MDDFRRIDLEDWPPRHITGWGPTPDDIDDWDPGDWEPDDPSEVPPNELYDLEEERDWEAELRVTLSMSS